MGFSAASAYLLGTIDERRSPHDLARLDRMALLLEELGNPQLSYPTIHVGGTSGKGSTSTLIASALTASGLKCGLHTKPHLSSMTERMRINGRPVREDRFAGLLSIIRPTLDDIAMRVGRPTYFETLLALSYIHFLEEKVDIAVIEVGLGGTLDGTNLLEPLVSVITNVGLDHREILGDTIEEIATDKAGIAKANTPLICAADGAARRVIERVCAENGAPFFSVLDLVTVESLSETSHGQHFTVKTSLLIPGRMEYVNAHPAVLFDVAHNPDKFASLAASIAKLFAGRRIHFVIAISETKEAALMLAALAQLPASYVFTSFEVAGRKAARPDRLATYVGDAGAWVRVIEDPVEAFTLARRAAGTEDLVVVTGSTVLVGILREWWTKNMSASTN
jgi:dihydrofolate synthase/folylpolyglutamate synthase